jgi:hypothetical protein
VIVESILDELLARGVTLFLDGDRMRYRAPKGAYTPELRTLVADHRDALRRRLASLCAGGPTDGLQVVATAREATSVMLRPGTENHGGDGETTTGSVDEADWSEYTTADGRDGLRRVDVADQQDIAPEACPTCNGSERWQDFGGGWHCERCEPRTRATRLRERARQVRGRYAKESDAVKRPRPP